MHRARSPSPPVSVLSFVGCFPIVLAGLGIGGSLFILYAGVCILEVGGVRRRFRSCFFILCLGKVIDVVNLLTENGVPACPIYTVRDVVEDPHIAVAREMVVEMEQPRVGTVNLLGCPVKLHENLL